MLRETQLIEINLPLLYVFSKSSLNISDIQVAEMSFLTLIFSTLQPLWKEHVNIIDFFYYSIPLNLGWTSYET
jgi:hypothetical protein